MKKSLLFVLLSALILGAVACSQPTLDTTIAPSTTSTQVPATEPAETLSPEEAALANASTGDELRALVAQYKQAKNHGALYAAALKLIEVDPLYTPGYTDAVTALLEMSKNNYAEIDRILAQGIAQGKDGPGYIGEWVTQNEPGLTMTLPTTPDSVPTDEPNTVGITSGNLANMTKVDDRWQAGLLTFQGGWVYFSALNEDRALYRTQVGGKGLQRIGDTRGSFLNVVGDWIYYSNSADSGRPYKMRLDGSESAKISEDSSEFLSVSDGWVYYCNLSDNGCLYTMRDDGSGLAKLVDTVVMSPCVAGEWVYYSAKKEGGFWRVRTDGSGNELLTDQVKGFWFILGDWIYYLADDKSTVISRMRLDGSDPAEVFRSEKPIVTFNAVGNRLLVSVSDKTNPDQILVVSADTFEVEQAVTKGTDVICTVGEDGVYFADWGDSSAWYMLDLGSGKVQKVE